MRMLMKSNGGRRGATDVPSAPRSGSGFVACDERLPAREPGYQASRGMTILAGERIGFGYWHETKRQWVDEFGESIGWEPTHWKG